MASYLIAIQSQADVVITYHNQQGLITHTIYVSSSILRHGSPCFDNMLGRSTQSTVTNPVGLPLQGDDPQAMAMMCRVLHSQSATVPGKVTPAALLAMAVVADKYECTGALALKFFSELCIRKLSKTAASHQLVDIFYAAFHFRQAELFGDVGKELILRSEGPIVDVAGSELSAYIEYLNKERQITLRELHKFIEDDIVTRSTLCAIDDDDHYDPNNDNQDLDDQNPQCKRSAALVTVLLRRLNRPGAKVWPAGAWLYGPKTLRSALDDLQSLYFRPIDFKDFRLTTGVDRGPFAPCGSGWCCATDNPGDAIRKEYAEEATKAAESVPRACYHCVRPGSGYECITKVEGEAAAESDKTG
ncbi:hypothetical protein LTR56_013662 [Elasticomyces elasticus]|nr:hypothetical protein LTR56_013662 [Elasticomyces elasticus]KAK3668515.1 hypothetical protein LTR22_000809 [Elasticomyces elasticus]KAK4930796.1 hypothetical protein LTR49_002560 [Elasticomyces elasticus]KAK5748257.1 hypothetical protein LTS12_021720 [Elasticomyces elasticus]